MIRRKENISKIRIGKLKEEKSNLEIKECTFNPKINEMYCFLKKFFKNIYCTYIRSKEIELKKRNNCIPLNVFQKLYQDSKKTPINERFFKIILNLNIKRRKSVNNTDMGQNTDFKNFLARQEIFLNEKERKIYELKFLF